MAREPLEDVFDAYTRKTALADSVRSYLSHSLRSADASRALADSVRSYLSHSLRSADASRALADSVRSYLSHSLRSADASRALAAALGLTLAACGGGVSESSDDAGNETDATSTDAHPYQGFDADTLPDMGTDDATERADVGDSASRADADDADDADHAGDAGAFGDADAGNAFDASDTASPVDAGTMSDAADGADGSDAASSPFDAGFPAAHSTMPQLQNHVGVAAILASPKLTSVTFNSYDQQSQIDSFVSTVGSSGSFYWTPTTHEYGVGAATVGTPVHLTEAAPTTIDDTAIQTWLGGKLDGTHAEFGTPQAGSLYVLFYPSTTTVTAGGYQGCVSFGGYHSSVYLTTGPWKNTSVPYAVIPECDAGGGPLLTATVAASHELIESVTDPFPTSVNPGPGWVGFDTDHTIWAVLVGGGGGESADLCQGTFGANFQPIGYTSVIQRTWSNASALAGHDPCVPELSGEIYYNSAPVLNDAVTLFQSGRPQATKGALIGLNQSKTIEVDLYSEAPTGPWNVSVTDFSTSLGNGPYLSFSWDATSGQNGTKLHLTITPLKATARFGGEPFMITSSNGSSHHEWIGFVAQN